VAAKGPQAFRTISEAADELGVPQHVLRFWETRFSFIRPMKRAGGRRFYRPQDIAVLAGVRALLHRDGMTIKAVQALYKEEGVKRLLAAAESQPGPPAPEVLHPQSAPELADDDLFAVRPPPALDLAGFDNFARPRLNPIGRAKLTETLAGLEEIKARLDGLLKPR
jgi:DNA-binding transcriptional MerR regulator